MKTTTGWIMVIGVALMLALGGCRKGEHATGESATQTIEPAKSKPDLSATDTNDVMTQTVDVEKGRSEGEGRGNDAGTATAASTSATTATAPGTATTTTTTH